MKKIVVFSLALILFVSSLSGNPLARIYQVDDPVYKKVESLSLEAGIVPFSSSGPVSGYELEINLNQIDTEKLSVSSKKSYIDVLNQIKNPYNGRIWGGNLKASLEGYLNTNNQFKYYDWVEGYNQRKPLIYGEAETIFGNSYAIISYAYQKRFSEQFFEGFNSNNMFGSKTTSSSAQNSLPHTAFLGLSGSWYTVTAGRDSIRLGRGSTGNLMVNDHVPYHDFIELRLFNKKIKYTFLALPMNELITQQFLENIYGDDWSDYEEKLGTGYYPKSYDKAGYWDTLFYGTKRRTYIAHRAELDLLSWWRLTLTEGTMFYTDTTDLRMFSPLLFLHNYQNFGEVNNSMGLETELALSPKWALNFQFFLDQFQTKGEQGSYGNMPPNAYAFLIGTRFTYPLKDWQLNGYFEGAYTSPFAYLRTNDNTHNYSDDEEHEKTQYNLDFVHVVNSYDSFTGVNWLGYPYGPDSIVVATEINSSYKDLLKITSLARFIIQGQNGLKIHNKNQVVELFDDPKKINPSTPYGSNPTYTLILGLGILTNIPKTNLSIYVRNYWLNRWDNTTHLFDYQLTMGVSYFL